MNNEERIRLWQENQNKIASDRLDAEEALAETAKGMEAAIRNLVVPNFEKLKELFDRKGIRSSIKVENIPYAIGKPSHELCATLKSDDVSISFGSNVTGGCFVWSVYEDLGSEIKEKKIPFGDFNDQKVKDACENFMARRFPLGD